MKYQWNYKMMNIYDAWMLGYSGKGVIIMLVDNAIDTDHPDLAKVSMDISKRYPSGTYSPDKVDTHATEVASILSGKGSHYVKGVAYGATLGSVSIWDGIPEHEALLYQVEKVAIYCNPWYPINDRSKVITPDERQQCISAMKRGASLGSIYVFASGNDPDIQTAFNPLLNIPEVIAVGASTNSGYSAGYTSVGPALLVSAPGGYINEQGIGIGILAALPITHNLQPYTYGSTGTSMACAHVSALIGLILEANPSLTWRDVQYILMYASVQRVSIPFVHNANGMLYSLYTGYGVPDAYKACKLAEQWNNVGPLHTVEHTTYNGTEISFMYIPNAYIEYVRLSIDVEGEIGINLRSPSNTLSTLLIPTSEPIKDIYMKDEAFRDESFNGSPWQVHIVGTEYTLNSISLEVGYYIRV